MKISSVKVPAAFTAGVLATLALPSRDARSLASETLSPEAMPSPVVQEAEPPSPQLSALLTQDPEPRRRAFSEPAAQEPLEPTLDELNCGDPRFREEFQKRSDQYNRWLEKAIRDCGLNARDIIPIPLQESLQVSVGDRVRQALESGMDGEVAEVIADQISEVRFQLQWSLREQLDTEGVVGTQREVSLPSHFDPSIPNQLGTIIHAGENGPELYLYDTVNGQLLIRQVPEDWPVCGTIMALKVAEDAAWDLDQ